MGAAFQRGGKCQVIIAETGVGVTSQQHDALEPRMRPSVRRVERRAQLAGERRCQRIVERAAEQFALGQCRKAETVI